MVSHLEFCQLGCKLCQQSGWCCVAMPTVVMSGRFHDSLAMQFAPEVFRCWWMHDYVRKALVGSSKKIWTSMGSNSWVFPLNAKAIVKWIFP